MRSRCSSCSPAASASTNDRGIPSARSRGRGLAVARRRRGDGRGAGAVPGPARCRSSRSSTTGARCESATIHDATDPRRCSARIFSSPSTRGQSSGKPVARAWERSRRRRRANDRCTRRSSSSVSCDDACASASAIATIAGRVASLPVAEITIASSRIRRPISSARRVLPIPGSPSIRTMCRPPAPTSRMREKISSSSSLRPTNGNDNEVHAGRGEVMPARSIPSTAS